MVLLTTFGSTVFLRFVRIIQGLACALGSRSLASSAASIRSMPLAIFRTDSSSCQVSLT